jgi:hypothetical protein
VLLPSLAVICSECKTNDGKNLGDGLQISLRSSGDFPEMLRCADAACAGRLSHTGLVLGRCGSNTGSASSTTGWRKPIYRCWRL